MRYIPFYDKQINIVYFSLTRCGGAEEYNLLRLIFFNQLIFDAVNCL
jgi:hypothetical protein